MPNWRRVYIPGGTFFFTVVTHERVPFLCEEPARRLLHDVMRRCQQQWPMQIEAIVLLPDHLHTIWALPPGDASYSQRWGWIKKEFTKSWVQTGYAETAQSAGRLRDGRRGVWQEKFWEHAIKDERDFARHVDYIHYNPVKHGLQKCPHAWAWSSFHRWVRAGTYERTWACSCSPGVTTTPDFRDIESSVGE